jgi:hypothetical protein
VFPVKTTAVVVTQIQCRAADGTIKMQTVSLTFPGSCRTIVILLEAWREAQVRCCSPWNTPASEHLTDAQRHGTTCVSQEPKYSCVQAQTRHATVMHEDLYNAKFFTCCLPQGADLAPKGKKAARISDKPEHRAMATHNVLILTYWQAQLVDALTRLRCVEIAPRWALGVRLWWGVCT